MMMMVVVICSCHVFFSYLHLSVCRSHAFGQCFMFLKIFLVNYFEPFIF